MNLFAIPTLLTAIILIYISILVYYKNKTSPSGIQFSFFCIICSIWLSGFSGMYQSTDPTVALLWARFGFCAIIFTPIAGYHFIVAFLGYKQQKILKILYFLGSLSLFISFSNLIYRDIGTFFWGYYPLAGILYPIFPLMFFLLIATSLYYIYINIKKAKEAANLKLLKQLNYLFIAFCFVLTGVTDYFPKFGFNIYPSAYISTLSFVFIIAYSIFKHQLMEISIVIKKSLVYSILLTCITITYLLIIFVVESIIQSTFQYESALIRTITAFAIGLFFIPLKNKIQKITDHYLFKATPPEMAEQNEKLLEQVTQSEKLKAIATLASGMAHEIKNPLTAIKTFSEHLPKKLDDKEFLIKFGKLVGSEVNRVDDLVHQLLEFARPSPLSINKIDLNKLLNETLELQNNAFIEHHITITKNFDTTTPLHIKADPNQLKQAFLNLILNAIESMPNGGTLTVSINIKELHNLRISIKDTGCGISKEAQKQIFEPFYSNKDHGTGLGLSITYGIIQEHKGEIHVISVVNKGTAFEITLPYTKS